jgi:hypothetical protein
MKYTHVLNRLYLAIFLSLSMLLSACSSMPLATKMHFLGAKPGDFFQLDPKELRVKATINSSVGIDLTSAVDLSATIEDENGLRQFRLALQKVKVETLAAKSGFFQSSPAYDVFLLKLSPQGISELKKLQLEGLSGSRKKGSFSAGIKFNRVRT